MPMWNRIIIKDAIANLESGQMALLLFFTRFHMHCKFSEFFHRPWKIQLFVIFFISVFLLFMIKHQWTCSHSQSKIKSYTLNVFSSLYWAQYIWRLFFFLPFLFTFSFKYKYGNSCWCYDLWTTVILIKELHKGYFNIRENIWLMVQ